MMVWGQAHPLKLLNSKVVWFVQVFPVVGLKLMMTNLPWIPLLNFAGMDTHTHTGFVYVSDYTIKCVSSNLNGICPQLDQSVAVSVRRIASVVGQIISMSTSCGNVTEIMARSCMLSLIREGPGTTLSSSVNGAGKSFYFGGTIWFL